MSPQPESFLSIRLSKSSALCLLDTLIDLAESEDGEHEVVNSILVKVSEELNWHSYLQNYSRRHINSTTAIKPESEST